MLTRLKNRGLLLFVAFSVFTLVLAGCGDKTVTTAPPEVTPQSTEGTTSKDGSTPGAQTLGIQENPNGSNPGLGSK